MASSIRRRTPKEGTVVGKFEERFIILERKPRKQKMSKRRSKASRSKTNEVIVIVKEEPAEELKPGEVITEKPPEAILLKNAGTWKSLSQTSHETRNIFKCQRLSKTKFFLFLKKSTIVKK